MNQEDTKTQNDTDSYYDEEMDTLDDLDLSFLDDEEGENSESDSEE